VGGWGQIFQFLASEDIKSNQMDLGVTVLAGLGGGHIDNLARAAFDDNEAVLSQGGTLHRVGGRGTGVGRLEGVFMLDAQVCQLRTDEALGLQRLAEPVPGQRIEAGLIRKLLTCASLSAMVDGREDAAKKSREKLEMEEPV
jgi:hypothetical protein